MADEGLDGGLVGGTDQISGLRLPVLRPRSRLPRENPGIENGEGSPCAVDAMVKIDRVNELPNKQRHQQIPTHCVKNEG